MKQVSYRVKNLDELKRIAEQLNAIPEYRNASDCVALVYAAKNIDLNSFLAEFNSTMPGIKMLGMTSFVQIQDAVQDDSGLVIIFLIFQNSYVKIFEYDNNEILAEEASFDFSAKVNAVKNAAAVQFFVGVLDNNWCDDFFASLELKSEKLVCGGGFAGTAWETGNIEFDRIKSFSKNGVGNKLCAVLFYGDELRAWSDYTLGWLPVGTEHTITKVDDYGKILCEIDDRPAAELFENYFDIDFDGDFLSNILDFPLIVDKYGCMIARGTTGVREDKSIYLAGVVSVGDKVRVSFGSISHILANTEEKSLRIWGRMPEGVLLTVCDARELYLGRENEQNEIQTFKDLELVVDGTSAFGEITRINGRMFKMNVALIAMSMREGKADKNLLNIEKIKGMSPKEKKGILPLMDRIYSFLRTSSEEYARYNALEKERELQRKVEIEKAANEAKSSFLSNMSHEIRTPINAVLGMNEMILRESKDEAVLEYANDIRSAGNTLLSIINDILDFSKIEAGKLEIIPGEYSISSLLNDLLVMLEPKAREKGLSMVFDIDSDAADLLYGDVVRIQQVLTNIINNAIKYTNYGEVLLTMRVAETTGDETWLEFHVKDTGIGIKQEDLDKLFSPFERIEEKRNHHIEGTGLGMSITMKLLKMMGTVLEVESEYGSGSDFHFKIRQKIIDFEKIGNFTERAKEKSSESSVNHELFRAPSANILVVDDTPMNLTVVKNLLKRTGINIDTAENGPESIFKASSNKYDIIFMDHRMPKMNGDEAMKKIRELPGDNPNRDTPIIILTANAVSGMREKFLEMGFDDFVSKPISSAQLEETIMKFLPDELIETGEIIEEEEENESEFIAAIREINYGEFDIKNGIIACGGSETYESVLKLFAESSLENTKIIYEDFVKGNLRDYTVRVHALKSSARLAGLTILSKFAERLEKCGENGEWDEIKIATPLLLGQYNSAAEIIRLAQVKSSDEIEGVAISTEMIDEAFSAIREFADAFDFDSADGVMQELKKYKIPEERLEIYRKLEDFMGKVERNQILDLLIGY